MELQEFVKKTLEQISNGVDDAREAGVIIYKTNYTSIEFDVSITTSASEKTSASAGIFIASFGLGGNIKDAHDYTALNRIKFHILTKVDK